MIRHANVKRFWVVSIILFGLLSIVASGGGGGDDSSSSLTAPAGDMSGVWQSQETVTGNCSDGQYPHVEQEIYQITQSGNTLTVNASSHSETINGTISGNQVSWNGSFSDNGGTLSVQFSGTLDSSDQVTGTATWQWSDGSYTCSGTTQISAAKQQSAQFNVTGLWTGNWNSSYGIDGTFSASITQQGSELSGTISVPYIGMENEQLKGSASGSNIVFGDINDRIVYTGSLSGQNSASGTYTYSVLSDSGTWTGTRSELPGLPGIPGTNSNPEGGAGSGSIFEKTFQSVTSYDIQLNYAADLASDGQYIWVPDNYDQKIYRLDTSGTIVSSFEAPEYYPYGMAYDGNHLWVADYGVYKIFEITQTGEVVSSFSVDHSFFVRGMTYDGSHLWLNAGEKIYCMDTTGNIVSSFDTPDYSFGGLAFDGTCLWLNDDMQHVIYQMDTNGNPIAKYDSPCERTGPSGSGLAFDGTYLWTMDSSHMYRMQP